nr:hypothetical protein [uncultured Pseudomonas sp.]
MTTNDKDCRPEFEAWLASCGKSPLMWNTSDAMLAAWAAAERAQREALARVEAEHADDVKRYRQLLNEAGRDRYAAQKQLAEAVGLLRKARYLTGYDLAIDDFLARHAQAEQQEARNAEVACESLRPENRRIEPVEPLRVPHTLEAQGAQAGDFWKYADKFKGRGCFTWPELEDAFNSGAALATQPAAGDPVAWIIESPEGCAPCKSINSLKHMAERYAAAGWSVTPLYAAPPAAAHGDEAVAFANELISGALEGGDFCGADIQELAVKHGLLREERREKPCREEGCTCAEYGFPTECYRKTAALAAMRAQGDGEIEA